MSGTRERPDIARAVVLALSALVFVAYLVRAMALVAYPFDWAPDEGLSLDYARRVMTRPDLLYARGAVPFPCAYTPLLPLLLAPIVALSQAPLFGARVLAMVWTAASSVAVFVLVRRLASVPLALAASALALAAFDMTFWLMLVRIDGLMVALWLAAAVPLLPARLERDADHLSGRRIAAGVTLLLLSVLAKPTAAIHGAPLVAAWILVHRPSAIRLIVTLAAAGLAVLAVLELLTSGGFSWTMRLWSHHGTVPGQTERILMHFAQRSAPIAAVAAAGFVASAVAGARPWRDASLGLVLGGLAAVPLLSKGGAMWNYLLPLLAAMAVAAGRWWGTAPRRAQTAGSVLAATVALVLAATRPFPVPTPRDEAAARAFYDFVQLTVQRHGGPILAARPDYAYFVSGQMVEMESTSFPYLVSGKVPGVELIQERLASGTYPLVIGGPFFPPPSGGYAEALESRYEAHGGCHMPFFYGTTPHVFYARRGEDLGFVPPPGVGCGLVPRPQPPDPTAQP